MSLRAVLFAFCGGGLLLSTATAQSALMRPQVRNCSGLMYPTADFLALYDPAPSCEKKLTIRVLMDGTMQTDENIDLSYESALGPGGLSEEYTFRSLSVRVVRREVVVRHKLSYLGKFNAKPYESSVQDSNCNSEFNPNIATCGLAKENGTFVPLSQGFCCDCTVCRTLGCDMNARANACSMKTSKVGACLRMSTLNYAGYSVDSVPELSYVLDVWVQGSVTEYITSNIFAVHPISASLTISPDAVQQYSSADEVIVMFEDRTVNQSLMGAPVTTNITSKYVFMPSTPATDDRVLAGSKEWLFLDPSSVTLDGSECDKVGTSYAAFAMQLNACALNVGTCLENQLNDFRAADLVIMKMGVLGSFLGPNYGTFSTQTGFNDTAFLTYPASVLPADAALNIIVNADHLMPRSAAADGTLTKLELAPLEDALIPATVVAPTSAYNPTTGVVSGGVQTTVQTFSSAPANFKVSLEGCSKFVQQSAIVPLWVTLANEESQQVTLLVQSTPNAPLNTYVTCEAILRDSDGKVLLVWIIQWGLTDTGFQRILSQTATTNSPSGDGGAGDGADSSGNSCEGCGFFTVSRNFKQLCVKFIVADAVVLFVALLAVLVLLTCFQEQICRCLCGSPTAVKDKKGKKSKKNSREPAQSRSAVHRNNPTSALPRFESYTPPQAPLQQQPQNVYLRPLTPQESAQYYAAAQEQQRILMQQELLARFQQQNYRFVSAANLSHDPYGNDNSLPGVGHTTQPPAHAPGTSRHHRTHYRASASSHIIEELDPEVDGTAFMSDDRVWGREEAEYVEDVVPLPRESSDRAADPPTTRYTSHLEDIDEDDGYRRPTPMPSREPFP